MKHQVMTRPKDTPPPPPSHPSGGKLALSGAGGVGEERRPEAAFDMWLQRGLHQLFDQVAKEPIPEELLRLIESHRKP